MEKTELVKTLLTTSAPLISTIIETFLKPKIKALADKVDLKQKNADIIYGNTFSKYLASTYAKHSIINTIVFHNQQKLLKELYIPLTVVNNKKIKFVIDDLDPQFIKEYQRILITDTAGMGKSTILKRIFLSIIEEGSSLPILIELRRLSKKKNILSEIRSQLNGASNKLTDEFILQLLLKGGFTFLLDGFDEIPIAERKSVTKQIQSFITEVGNDSIFIMSSRPEDALSAFGDFQEFKIQPLSKNEAFDLLRKYDGSGKNSNILVEKLQEKKNQDIDEFLRNPLLVSLLYAAFEFKQTIPLKKHIFYRQVYDALFESHDLTKGDSFIRDKFSGLDIDEFHRILRYIGYNSLIKGKIEFTKDEILLLIKESKDFASGLNFKESDFLKDLLKTVPLFTIDGMDYKWSHKSLQEYFAAQFIFLDAKDQQKNILLKLYNHSDNERFINMIDIYYSIDYKSLSEAIIYTFLNDYFAWLKNTYKHFKNDAVLERQELTFGFDYIYLQSKDLSSTAAWDIIKGTNLKAQGRWRLLHNNYLDSLTHKILVSPKKTFTYLSYFRQKGEKFIIRPQEQYSEEDFTIQSKIDRAYLISDNKTSICNSPHNFAQINRLIKAYNFQQLIIDKKEAQRVILKLKNQLSEKKRNKLLDF